MASKNGSIREIKKLEKKQRIHEAAIRVMARNGYHGTTVSQIAKAARVADGTLYLYFENKDDLLVGIFDEIMDRFISEGLSVIDEMADPIEKLKRIVELHLKALGSDEDLACIFQIELRHNIHHMKRFSQSKLRQYFNIVERVIRDAQEQGHIRSEVNPWITAKLLFGAVDEMATNWVLRTRDYNLIDMAKPTLDIFLNGLCTNHEEPQSEASIEEGRQTLP
ncbi:TetR/AcrR family transcriptional regulator [Sulfidibacter corallicola]|uniref:TetR/AcrR family transcriptional regulator n=1 Tax=Sulfidibacter corallicola TaxID=2818388 RepID=A0A8A4TPR8_SULCO|nr:TetR/AcrR family transcriptional regulator [Sulfidibacter corallicola]QTD51072.1 TetR/AcrR family transcriptional regulator [Sulfidibacter corallicola]